MESDTHHQLHGFSVFLERMFFKKNLNFILEQEREVAQVGAWGRGRERERERETERERDS